MTDIFDAVLVYSLNCSQTFILYGDALVMTDMILCGREDHITATGSTTFEKSRAKSIQNETC